VFEYIEALRGVRWQEVVLVAGFIAIFAAQFWFARWRYKRRLEAIRALLIDGELTEHGKVSGAFEGRAVEVKYADRSEGSSVSPWTEVTASHKSVELDLALRPQGILASAIGRAASGVDVKLGDDRFDGAFILDGAPADAVRAVLDANVRKRLMDLRPVELTTKSGAIVIAKKKWLGVDDVAPMLAAVCEVAASVDRLPGAEGGAYRAATLDRTDELAALERARARTQRLRNWLIAIGVGLFVVLWLLSVFWPRS
jgi:hypothetical protein